MLEGSIARLYYMMVSLYYYQTAAVAGKFHILYALGFIVKGRYFHLQFLYHNSVRLFRQYLANILQKFLSLWWYWSSLSISSGSQQNKFSNFISFIHFPSSATAYRLFSFILDDDIISRCQYAGRMGYLIEAKISRSIASRHLFAFRYEYHDIKRKILLVLRWWWKIITIYVVKLFSRKLHAFITIISSQHFM